MFDDHVITCVFVGYIRTIKQYQFFDHKAKREHYTRDIMFHISCPYYEMEKEKEKLQRTLPPVDDGEMSHESELQKKHELTTQLGQTEQKSKPRKLQNILGSVWQLLVGSRNRRERASCVEVEAEKEEEQGKTGP